MLKITDLQKSYRVGNTERKVLAGVTLEVKKGEFAAIMGPSGSGKTTVMNCVSSYIPFDAGEIEIGGVKPDRLTENELAKLRNQDLGFVFQDFMLLDGLTVRENILMPRIIAGKADASAEQSAERLCEMFGISHISEKYPAELSGGEKQRTAVARALINNPGLILADEPTGNLDSASSGAVIRAFRKAVEELGATVFMVTHDSFAASRCDRVIMMKDGRVYDNLLNSGDCAMFHDRLLEAVKHMAGEGV